MNLRNLQTLIAIRDLGSFAKTADHLNMTLSSVSMQMKSLEEELNVELFDRSFRPPKLTPMGRRIARQAIEVIQASDTLFETSQAPDDLVGDYRIGFVLTSSIRLLPGFLARARTSVPKARFIVETGLSDDLLNRVQNATLDAAIITEVDLPQGLGAHVLANEELVFCLPKVNGSWSLIKCMEELPFIHFMPNTGIGRLIAQHLRKKDLHPRHVIVLDSVEAVAECVREGVGFSILPAPDIERHNRNDVILRSLDEEKVMRKLVLTYLNGGPLRAKANLLADLFQGKAVRRD